MKHIKTGKIQNTALLFLLIAPFTVTFYATYIFNPVHMGNIWLYCLLLIADGIAMLNVVTLWLTILLDLMQPEYQKRELRYNKDWVAQHNPSIDVYIPVSQESPEIIEQTVRAAVYMDYPHKTYVLDDGDSPETKRLTKDLGALYVSRPSHEKGYAKSGNLNYGLRQGKGEFFAVFDADHAPQKSFLEELLPFFENARVALVQTPQQYTNTKNFIAAGTAQAQEIFYKYVQPAKNSYNASFCVGTNMLYRRSAIDAIDGIALMDHSEDIWTTIRLHEKGYETVFYNKVLAEGRAPETIPSFFRQQNRWAQGGFSLFFSHNPLFIQDLTIDQRLQYFFSNIHYFTAFSVVIYLLLPLIYLLFGYHPMNLMESSDWPMHFIPYFITIYFLPFFLLRKINLATMSTAFASFWPYLEAFFATVVKSKYTWVATETRRKTQVIIMQYIWPHVFLIVLSFLAIFIGWLNVVDTTTTFITTGWVLVNAYLLFLFVRHGIAVN